CDTPRTALRGRCRASNTSDEPLGDGFKQFPRVTFEDDSPGLQFLLHVIRQVTLDEFAAEVESVSFSLTVLLFRIVAFEDVVDQIGPTVGLEAIRAIPGHQ